MPLAVAAKDLVPPHQGPWYEAGLVESAEAGPEALMLPLVLWSRAWHGPDREALVAAAVSLARLTHSKAEALAGAAAVALALSEVAEADVVPSDLYTRVRAHLPLVERWTGAAPRFETLRKIDASTRPYDAVFDPDAIRGALQGLVEGVDPTQAPPELVRAVERVAGLSRERA